MKQAAHTPDHTEKSPRGKTPAPIQKTPVLALEALQSPHPARQRELVMNLQRTIGNSATTKFVQRWQHENRAAHIQRQGGGAAAPAADPAAEAMTALRSGTLLERNTAQMIDTGRISYLYIDQCTADPDSSLDASSPFSDVIHPTTGERMRIQKNAIGFRHGNTVFVSRTLSAESIKGTLVHEVNHAMRGDSESEDDASSFARYRDEFQAYWVDGGFIGEPDLDKRAKNIRDHILRDYPSIKTRYDSDTDFKNEVDNHKRPDGNIINSVRWMIVEEACRGAGTNEDQVFAAIRAMNAEERRVVRASASFMQLMRDELSGDDLAIVYLLLFEFSENAVACVQAMSGMGTDEEAIYNNLLQISSAERKRLLAWSWFMNRLRDELNDSEMEVATRILNQ